MNKSTALWLVIIGFVGLTYQARSYERKIHNYLVKFTGVPGAKVYGNAGWTNTNRKIPVMHLDNANTVLPAIIELTPPEGSVVTATGFATEQNELIIRIYRDGIECTEEVISGNSGTTSVVCREE